MVQPVLCHRQHAVTSRWLLSLRDSRVDNIKLKILDSCVLARLREAARRQDVEELTVFVSPTRAN